jgi:hypothetical protein
MTVIHELIAALLGRLLLLRLMQFQTMPHNALYLYFIVFELQAKICEMESAHTFAIVIGG